jgi:hypothetical protein
MSGPAFTRLSVPAPISAVNYQEFEEARKARARIASLSPEERAAMGLPEVGWEKIFWGGLGWDDSQNP